MKIDIEPITEQAGEMDKICMEMRQIPHLHVVRLASGTDYTVKFDDKELSEFLPKRTVSEMLAMWEEGIKRQYDEAKTALETGLHPTYTVQVLDMFNRPTGETKPKELDRYEKAHFKRVMADREKEFGKLTFHKIVP
jgi:hypothetical protein